MPIRVSTAGQNVRQRHRKADQTPTIPVPVPTQIASGSAVARNARVVNPKARPPAEMINRHQRPTVSPNVNNNRANNASNNHANNANNNHAAADVREIADVNRRRRKSAHHAALSCNVE
jgi:hypothetical protein